MIGQRGQKLALAFAGVVVFLVVAELALRLMNYSYTPLRIETIKRYTEWRYFHSYEDRHFIYDPDLFWRPRPGIPLFNAHGFRGRPLPVGHGVNEVRIFAVGDSNTLGWYGEKNGNWPMYLEELLTQEYPDLTVQNAGISGYSSFQGLRRVKEILEFQPDLILFSFGANDAMRVAMSDAEYARRATYSLALERLMLKFRVGHLLRAILDRPWGGARERVVPRVSLEEYRANLLELIRTCRRRQVTVVVLTRPFTGPSPHEWWWKNFAPQYNEAVLQVARHQGVPVIDVFAAFQRRDALFIDESHLTEDGYRRMAEFIAREIRPLVAAMAGRGRERKAGVGP